MVEDGAVDLGIPGLTDAVEVARGGFSTVFRARQRAMERTVAVKLIHATVVDPVAGEHFFARCAPPADCPSTRTSHRSTTSARPRPGSPT